MPSASRPAAVLGVSAFYHDSAAALLVDGQVVAAAQEERFTRVKGTADLPVESVEFVLREAGLAPRDLAAVAFYESPSARLDRLLSTQMLGDRRGEAAFAASMRSWLPDKLWAGSQLARLLGPGAPSVMFCDHHLSHAASCFYPSPFEQAAVLTMDGVGEWSTTTLCRGKGSEMEMLSQVEYPNSLGLLYSAVTAYCGFKVNSGEYKLMGLAPFGRPRFLDVLLREVLYLAGDGSFALNPRFFAYQYSLRPYTPLLADLFQGPARDPEGPLDRRFADVAASVQAALDLAVEGLARHARKATGLPDLCLAGGVALNVVSVGRLERLGIFDRVWVQPAAGDAGGALGAAYWAWHEVLGQPRQVPGSDGMSGAFLGPLPCASGEDPVDLLAEFGLTGERLPEAELAGQVAGLVASGSAVAVARGRMEFGPRALGNRSILADARDPDMQRRLNVKVKFREGFRPFAPVVLAEHADQWFDGAGQGSPYMLKAYPLLQRRRLARPDSLDGLDGMDGLDGVDEVGQWDVHAWVRQVRSSVPAVTHVDFSARVQTVDRDRHPFLHLVLSAFADLTGCPVMVNTSLNVRGEPIACSARDAVGCFLGTDVDALVLDDVLVLKSQQPAGSLRPPSGPQGMD